MREPRGRNAPPVFLSDLVSGNTEARRVCDDSDVGRFCGQSSGTGENTEERSGFEQCKLRIRGLNESTTEDALTNFIEAMSGEEVKEVQKLRNGNAIVTMVNDITSKSMFDDFC